MKPPCPHCECRCFPIPERMGRPAARLGGDGMYLDRVRTVEVQARHSIASELFKSSRIVTSADLPIAEGFAKPKTQSPDSSRRSGLWLVAVAKDVWPTPWSVPPGFPFLYSMHDYSLDDKRTNRQTVSRGKWSSDARISSRSGGTPVENRTPPCHDGLGSVLAGLR